MNGATTSTTSTSRSPTPSSRRERVATVAERVSATGQVLDPLDPGSVHRAVDALVAGGVESIAVCLLHSYVNPAHEQAVCAAVERRAPGWR